MIGKLLTEHALKFLGLKGGCRGSSESLLVKMSNCWKFHAAAYSNISYPLKYIRDNLIHIANLCNEQFISIQRIKLTYMHTVSPFGFNARKLAGKQLHVSANSLVTHVVHCSHGSPGHGYSDRSSHAVPRLASDHVPYELVMKSDSSIATSSIT